MAAGFAPGSRGQFGSTFTGYGVGIPAYLNDAQDQVGKYWRMIEFGTTGFKGHWLGGLWNDGGGLLSPFSGMAGRGENEGVFVPFGPQGSGADNRAEAEAAAIKALGYLAATGQLMGSAALNKDGSPSQFAAYRTLRARILSGKGGPSLGQVRAEIPAMDAYSKAAAAFHPAEQEARAVHDVLSKMPIFRPYYNDYRRTDPATLRKGSLVPGELASAQFRGERGFFVGNVLSTGTRSLGNGDRIEQQFRAQLTDLNRVLAERLAHAVVDQIEKAKVRTLMSKQALENVTLNAANRFPS